MRRSGSSGLPCSLSIVVPILLLLVSGKALAGGIHARRNGHERTRSLPGVFPQTIPAHEYSEDSAGISETLNTAAPTDTSRNAFFQSIGTNGRACVSCHEPRSAWTVSTASIQKRFAESNGTDPIFRVNDGATCDTDDVSTPQARREAYKLLLQQGLIRIALTIPSSRDFEITAVSDPYGCTDLTSSTVSFYRRPLPSANLKFLGCPSGNPPSNCGLSVMWDGREPSLRSQATNATLGHAQGNSAPTDAQLDQIVNFETGIFDAQIFDQEAGRLDKHGATGGPDNLSAQEFYIGINDVLSPGFTDDVFTLYGAWANQSGDDDARARAAIARGEALFNTRQFTITGVNGLNLFSFDPLGAAPFTGGCVTCHDSPNVGNHSKKLPIDIGVPDAVTPVLNIARCRSSPSPAPRQRGLSLASSSTSPILAARQSPANVPMWANSRGRFCTVSLPVRHILIMDRRPRWMMWLISTTSALASVSRIKKKQTWSLS